MHRLLPALTPGRHDEDEIDLGEAYALPDGPFVRGNMVSSVDGSASADGVSGPLSGDTDRRLLQTLRRLCDAVIVGAGTVRSENYGGVKFADEIRLQRVESGKSPVPPVVIVSNRAQFDPTARVFLDTTVPPVILTTETAADACRRDLGVLAEVVAVGDKEVDLTLAVSELADRGISQPLCEGGPGLLTRLIAADVVDELCLTVAPTLSGAASTRILNADNPFEPQRRVRLTDLFIDDAGFLFSRWSLRN